MKAYKKIAAACCGIVMLTSAVPVCANASVDYDINMDSKTDINDVTALQKYLVGLSVSIDKTKADVNGDGVLNVRDATALQIIINKTVPEETITDIPKETEDIGDLV